MKLILLSLHVFLIVSCVNTKSTNEFKSCENCDVSTTSINGNDSLKFNDSDAPLNLKLKVQDSVFLIENLRKLDTFISFQSNIFKSTVLSVEAEDGLVSKYTSVDTTLTCTYNNEEVKIFIIENYFKHYRTQQIYNLAIVASYKSGILSTFYNQKSDDGKIYINRIKGINLPCFTDTSKVVSFLIL